MKKEKLFYLSFNGKAVHKQHKLRSNTFNFRQLEKNLLSKNIIVSTYWINPVTISLNQENLSQISWGF